MSRKVRRRAAPKRATRWIYGGNVRQFDPPEVGDDHCAVVFRPLFCIAEEGSVAYELVNGEVDLDFMDKQSATVTRVVGDLQLQGSMTVTGLTITGWTNLKHVPPLVRLGLLCVNDIEDTPAYVPPDLWQADAAEDADWMWRAQIPCAADMVVFDPSAANQVGEMRYDWVRREHVDVTVNRKLGREGSLFLVAQLGVFNPLNIATTEYPAPAVVMCHDLRVLVKL